MSKKRAKKKAGTKRKIRCPGCGSKIGKLAVRCPRCGRPVSTARAAAKAFARNMGVAFVGKRARPPVAKTADGTLYTLQCWSGHPPGEKGDRFCATCGESFTATLSEHRERLRKAAEPLASHPLYQRYLAETRPGERERRRTLITQETLGRDPGAAVRFLAKGYGHADPDALAARRARP